MEYHAKLCRASWLVTATRTLIPPLRNSWLATRSSTGAAIRGANRPRVQKKDLGREVARPCRRDRPRGQ
eukprot:5080144-Lingulodinium_polyedra.AAC.1